MCRPLVSTTVPEVAKVNERRLCPDRDAVKQSKEKKYQAQCLFEVPVIGSCGQACGYGAYEWHGIRMMDTTPVMNIIASFQICGRIQKRRPDAEANGGVRQGETSGKPTENAPTIDTSGDSESSVCRGLASAACHRYSTSS